MAYRYMMHVFCDECSVPHPAGIVIEQKELLSQEQSVGDIYDGREVPVADCDDDEQLLPVPQHRQDVHPKRQPPSVPRVDACAHKSWRRGHLAEA